MRLILISSSLDARVAKLRVMFIELSAFPTSEDIVRSHGLLQHCKIWIWVLRPIDCLRNFNCRKQSYIKECPHDWITSLLLFHYAGVILTNGRSGRETTFWTEWPKSVWQKFVIPCLQTNLTQWFKQSFVQKQKMKFFEEVPGLFVSINWEKWSENVSRFSA